MILKMKKYFAPGRINLIGEHIDYNGGLVLPAAISIGITAYVSESSDAMFKLSSATHSEVLTFSATENFTFNKEKAWLNYPLGVFQFLKEKGFSLKPLHIHFESSLPESSGLSSSASVEVLTMFLLLQESGYEISHQQIAVWCKEVENDFIGVNCGIMDQFCIANAEPKSAMMLNCATLEYENTEIDFGEKKIAILNTKKPRNLIHSKYNERRSECEQALAIIQQKRNSAAANLCECLIEDIECIENEIIKQRARHVIEENKRVKQAVEVLKNNDIATFEALLKQSHQSLKHNYEVSGTELDAIVDAALNHESCSGARMTGAGFGGCAIALVQANAFEEFKDFVIKQYAQATGLQAEIYLCDIGEGVKILE